LVMYRGMLDTPAQHRWNRERLISSGDRDERGMSGRRVSSGPGQRHFRLHGVGDAVGHAGVQRRSTDVDDTRRARPPDPTDAHRLPRGARPTFRHRPAALSALRVRPRTGRRSVASRRFTCSCCMQLLQRAARKNCT